MIFDINAVIKDLIHKSDMTLKLIETGYPISTANKILKIEGASRLVDSVKCPYSKESQKEYADSTCRSVSMAFCETVLDVESEGSHNTTVVSSFQIGKDICNHGWIGINYKGKIRYYHVTLPYGKAIRGNPRSISASYIANIIILLLSKAIGIGNSTNMYIDNVCDSEGNIVWEELLGHDMGVSYVVHKGTSIKRLEDYRGPQLFVYPGSFNPVHKGHLSILNKTEEFAGASPVLPSISLNNIDPGKADVKSNILERIENLSKQGYEDVLITTSGRFKDFISFSKRIGGKITIVCGWDTYLRIEKELFNSNLKFLIFDRENYIENNPKDKEVLFCRGNDNIKLITGQQHQHLSSTKLRKDG